MSDDYLDLQPVLSEEEFYGYIGENELERGKEQPTIVIREDGMVFVVPAEHRARKHELIFSASETWVLDRVMEPILDVGCGGGYHLEYLNEKGYQNLTGIDQFEYCVKATRRKGIKALRTNIFREIPQLDMQFRTILLMSGNIGIGGSREGAIQLLKRLESLLLPEGEILGTTMDWTKAAKDTDRRYYEYKQSIGKPGVIRLRFQYMEQLSNWIEIWNASENDLHEIAGINGLEVNELQPFSNGQVLAFRMRRNS